jgi:hypothetical protein
MLIGFTDPIQFFNTVNHGFEKYEKQFSNKLEDLIDLEGESY